MKNKCFKIGLLLILSLCLFTSSCSQFKQKNIIENQITNKTVNYDNITIDQLEEAVNNTVKMVENAVVGVSIKTVSNVMINGRVYASEDTEAIGSGVIYKRVENKNASGILTGYTYYLLTNRHVITSESSLNTKIYVYLGNEDCEIEAKIIGYDEKVDIAVITFEHTSLIQPVEFGDSDALEKGQFVIAIGNPDGYDFYGSVTFGVVSGKLRYISDDTDGDNINDYNATYIQHDASINPGNSGGGLFTIDGKLVGINSLKFVDDTIDNMGFAIPINVAKVLACDYIEKNIAIKRPTLGVTGIAVRDLTNATIAENGLMPLPDIYGNSSKYGIYVSDITSGGTISMTNVAKDDIILTFDGEKITTLNVLSAKLNSLDDYVIGSKVVITYYSRKQAKIVTETITLK